MKFKWENTTVPNAMTHPQAPPRALCSLHLWDGAGEEKEYNPNPERFNLSNPHLCNFSSPIL